MSRNKENRRGRFSVRPLSELDIMTTAFPSANEFFGYYKTKLDSYHKQLLEIAEIFKLYQEKFERDCYLENKIKTREEDVMKMEIALADSKKCSLDERQNYINLVAENEQLKLENEDLKVKFEVLLILTNKKEEDVIRHLEKHPGASKAASRMYEIREEIAACSGKNASMNTITSPVLLTKRIKVLENQIEQLKQVHSTKNYLVSNTLKSVRDQTELKLSEELIKNRELTTRLEDSNFLLHKALADALNKQNESFVMEHQWSEERLMFTREIAKLSQAQGRNQRTPEPGEPKDNSSADNQQLSRKMEQQLSQIQNDLMDKEIQLEEQILRIEEMSYLKDLVMQEFDHYKTAAAKASKTLNEEVRLWKRRYEVAEGRRMTDNMGFREDLKAIRKVQRKLEDSLAISTLQQRAREKEDSHSTDLRMRLPLTSISARSRDRSTGRKNQPDPRLPKTAREKTGTTAEFFPPPPQTSGSARLTQEQIAWLVAKSGDKVQLFEQLLRKK